MSTATQGSLDLMHWGREEEGGKLECPLLIDQRGDFRETRSNGRALGKQSRTPDLKERVCKQT